MLTQRQLAEATALQNEVIAKLPRPPDDYYVLGMERPVVDWYRAKFVPVARPYANTDD